MKTTATPSPATRPKRLASVRDLVKATAADEGQVREFDRRIMGSVIVNALICTRAAVGMTQADVAEKMECNQSTVSKLENAADADLTLQEIASYLRATGGRLNLGIGKQPNRTIRIKELAHCLKDELESLADLSSNSDDLTIRQSINGFFGEAWYNLFNILCDATARLPRETEESSSLQVWGSETACMAVGKRAERMPC